ncbi:MAG: hypothetical protein KAS07_00435 [Candidatus Pacebacteria bacterium]|nr:hypothetical protein [Candidatus Paceibacterota bacterium]
MSIQQTLFAPRTLEQTISCLPHNPRDIIHRELYKFFEKGSTFVCSDGDYDEEIQRAHWRNSNFVKHLLRKYPPFDLGVGIIFFLAQLNENKVIYNVREKGIRTYTINHLFQKERGEPAQYLLELMQEVCVSQRCNFSKYSKEVSKLLLKNIGNEEGKMEKFLLNILEMVGTRKDIEVLQKYVENVKSGKFGTPKRILDGDIARIVRGAVKEKLQWELLARIYSAMCVLIRRSQSA